MLRKTALMSSGRLLAADSHRRHRSTQWARHWAKCAIYRPVLARRWLHGQVEQHKSSSHVGRRQELNSPAKLKAGCLCIVAASTSIRKQWSRPRRRVPIGRKTWVRLFEGVFHRILSEENGNTYTLSMTRRISTLQSPLSRRSRT